MAAVIHIRNSHRLDESASEAGGIARPSLRVLDGGRSAAVVRMHRTYVVRRLAVATVLVVLLAAVATIGTAVFGDAASGTAGAAAPGVTAGTTTGVHVVQPGDTLWSIATTLDPAADPRHTVRRLLELNGTQRDLGGSGQLRIGQELNVPVRLG